MLVATANQRFKKNSERRERFKETLLELCLGSPPDRLAKGAGWEDPNARGARKRAEGLQRRKDAIKARDTTQATDAGDVLGSDDDTPLGFPE